MFLRKRLLWIPLLTMLGMAILYPILVLPLRPADAAHALTQLPTLQMLSSTFLDQNLPKDGSTLTLVSIPFTTTAVAKVEATSLIDAQWGTGCCGQAGPIVTETTVMAIDGVPLGSSSWSSNFTLPAQLSITRTRTGLAPGHHVLTVNCTGSGDPLGQGFPVLARSGGTSVIIVSGA